jgi:predicted enzyme related to lactoylglutathione lyase
MSLVLLAQGYSALALARSGTLPIIPAIQEKTMPHGKICYLKIPADRPGDAATFYSDIFGWKVRERSNGNLAFDDSGSVSGTWVKQAEPTSEKRTRIYIMVDSIASTLQQIVAAGGKVLTPRTELDHGKGGAIAFFADPAGNEFGLHEEPGA